MKRLLMVVCCVLLPVACAADSVEPSGTNTSRAGLSAPTLTPVPCGAVDGKKAYTWNGTRGELLVADAFAGCTDTAHDIAMDMTDFPLADKALRDVIGHMKEALPANGQGQPVSKWASFRQDETRNCDPDNVNLGKAAVIVPYALQETLYLNQPPNPSSFRAWTISLADMDLRWAGLNLCVAMRLRELSPGAAGAEALLMSSAEQRELLETIRERAQIAMLHYALLGSVFASDGPGKAIPGNSELPLCPLPPWHQICELWDKNNPARHVRVPFLQYFGHQAPASWLRGMGRDFATAVQLHTEVTREVTSLLARSRSAGLERGGDAETRADETWGPGSWQQRLMAAAYGGDPLVTDDKSPWQHPMGSGYTITWPSRTESPYVRHESQEPQIGKALSLIQKHDVLDLTLVAGSGQCRTIDVPQSGTSVYDALELAVRKALCLDYNTATGACTPVSLPADPEKHGLWLHYGIRSHHVATAVEIAADLVGPELDVANGSACSTWRYGSHRVAGALSMGAGKVHVSGSALFAPREPRDTAGLFSRRASLRLPPAWQIEPGVESHLQGFSTDRICEPLAPGMPCWEILGGVAAEAQRTMGAIRAITATREAVAAAVERLRSLPAGAPQRARLDDYFGSSDGILRVSSGAVGNSFTFHPVTASGSVHHPSAGRSAWVGTVTAKPEDDFFTPADGTFLVLIAVKNDGRAGDLVAHPGARAFGRGVPELISDAAFVTGNFALLQPIPGEATAGLRRWNTTPWISLGGPVNYQTAWTFFVWRGTVQDFIDTITSLSPPPSSDALAQPKLHGRVRLLASSLVVDTESVLRADYFSQDGALGTWLTKQIQADEVEPSEPAYDGFGLPRAWVPPASSEVLGGEPGVPAFRHYLKAAEASSKEAGNAVHTAMQNLLDQAADEAKSDELETKLDNETKRSLASMKESAQKLCGYDNTKCDIKTSTTAVKREWYPSLSGFVDPTGETCLADLAQPSASDPDQAVTIAEGLLRCLAKAAINSLTSTEFELAFPVASTLAASAVPGFSDFAGGEVQSAMIEQWRAVKAPDERFSLLLKQIDASVAAMKTAAKVVGQQSLIKGNKCGVDDLARDVLSGAMKGAASGAAAGGVGAIAGGVWGASEAAEEHMEKCKELSAALGVAKAKQYQTSVEALANVISTLTGLINDRAAIVQSGARIQQLATGARLEQERYQLELDLFESQVGAEQATLRTSFGLHRRYRSYDAWRAKALLDNARRYAVAARRGIEAHYVADLSRITQDEAFVASPATWANEIYEYDLSLPAAVGLTVPGSESHPDGIYSDKVADYVSNLNGFVDGFAVSRPSAVAHEDVEVVTLKGLAPGQEFTVDSGGAPVVAYPDFGTWQVKCPGTGWGAVPPVSGGGAEAACVDFAACGCAAGDMPCVKANTSCVKPRPTAARVVFWLDPWGRLNQNLSAGQPNARYNARWSKLAVNLVGTGIRDCKLAPDPLTCYSEGFLRYDLRHVGRAWITDYSGQWRALAVPPGLIEQGKALAAEVWLDPLEDGWSTSYINPVARTEFFWRPLGGAYVLEVQTGPEVRLERLERVQMLLGSSYWVKQQ